MSVDYLSADDKTAYMEHFNDHEELWVFAYGSLLWKPEFEIAEKRLSVIEDFHRSFCLISNHYRGTKERTGLVLGLDEGGECHGLALRVEKHNMAQTLSPLWDREMITYAYLPVMLNAWVDGKAVRVLTFVMNKNHEQYAGKLSEEAILQRIMKAHGKGGSNVDYLLQTAKHLQEYNIRDEHVERLAKKAAFQLIIG